MALFVWSLFILLATYASVSRSQTADWNYNDTSDEGPEHWYERYELCGHNAQSPVNIVTKDLQAINLTGLQLTNYSTKITGKFNLVNSGHSAQVNIPNDSIKISGAGLGSTYVLEQFHFHWGETSSTGSEHKVDGKFHPLEIHLVHYNSAKYKSVSEASSHVNDTTALAVLGVFVDVTTDSKRSPPAINSLINALSEIPYEGDATQIDSFELSQILPCDRSMYRYNGSLTTPGCAEVVVWSVFSNPIYIVNDQISKFRTLHSNVKGQPAQELTHNFRPIQPLNGRTVFQYNDPSPTTCEAQIFARPHPAVAAITAGAFAQSLLAYRR